MAVTGLGRFERFSKIWILKNMVVTGLGRFERFSKIWNLKNMKSQKYARHRT
jgi:hypothetical protein